MAADGAALPTDALQAKIQEICNGDLFARFSNTELTNPNNDVARNLVSFLQKISNVKDLPTTMKYINQRDKGITDIDQRYSTRILTILKKIRHNWATHSERIQSTGEITAAHTMCLFVCGLLTHPTMSFNALVKSHPAYADAFFDYMIEQSTTKITVAVVDERDQV